MRPGFVVGVFAFGVLMTALFVVFAVRQALPTAKIVRFGVLIFGLFTLFPMGYSAFVLPRAEIFPRLDRRNARLAVAVFGLLVVAAVVTLAVIRSLGSA